MRKILKNCLCVAFVFLLFGCGNKSVETPTADSENIQNQANDMSILYYALERKSTRRGISDGAKRSEQVDCFAISDDGLPIWHQKSLDYFVGMGAEVTKTYYIFDNTNAEKLVDYSKNVSDNDLNNKAAMESVLTNERNKAQSLGFTQSEFETFDVLSIDADGFVKEKFEEGYSRGTSYLYSGGKRISSVSCQFGGVDTDFKYEYEGNITYIKMWYPSTNIMSEATMTLDDKTGSIITEQITHDYRKDTEIVRRSETIKNVYGLAEQMTEEEYITSYSYRFQKLEIPTNKLQYYCNLYSSLGISYVIPQDGMEVEDIIQ